MSPSPLWLDLLHDGLERRFSGAAVAIGRLGQPVEFRCLGYTHPQGSGSPVTSQTLFDLSSLTKVLVTTTLIARRVHRQDLSLEDRLASWWPELPWSEAWTSLTLRDVLAHCAGFPAWKDYANQAPEAVVHDIVRTQTLYARGERTLYSDLGFILLAAVLAHRTQRSWTQMCAEEVANPLGIRALVSCPFRRKNYPQGVASSGDPETENVVPNDANACAMGGASGHAGFFADIQSCAQVAQMWMDAWQGKKGFLSSEVVNHFCVPVQVKTGEGRALGWDVPSGAKSTAGGNISPRSIGHLGFTGTSIWMDLERKAWVVLLTNRLSLKTSREDMNEFRHQFHDAAWEWVDR